ATLRFPDFRAEERTFTLVSQLAGRSGRGEHGGSVLVQTLCPETSCLQHAARHQTSAFLEQELARRRALRYPPFSRLIRVVTAASDQAAADRASARIRSLAGQPNLEILGPAPLFKVKDRYRTMLVLKELPSAGGGGAGGAEGGKAPRVDGFGEGSPVGAVGDAVQAAASDKAFRGVRFSVDVDPQ